MRRRCMTEKPQIDAIVFAALEKATLGERDAYLDAACVLATRNCALAVDRLVATLPGKRRRFARTRRGH